MSDNEPTGLEGIMIRANLRAAWRNADFTLMASSITGAPAAPAR